MNKSIQDLSLKGEFITPPTIESKFLKDLIREFNFQVNCEDLKEILYVAFIKFKSAQSYDLNKTVTTKKQTIHRLKNIAHSLEEAAENMSRLSPEEHFSLEGTSKVTGLPYEPRNHVNYLLNLATTYRTTSKRLESAMVFDSKQYKTTSSKSRALNEIINDLCFFYSDNKGSIKSYWNEVDGEHKGDAFAFCRKVISHLGIKASNHQIHDRIKKFKKGAS